MTLHDNGTLEDRAQELLYFWHEFCLDRYAPSVMSPTVELVDEFTGWIGNQWATQEMERENRELVTIWWQKRDLGLFSWERELLDAWAQFSNEDRSMDFVRVNPSTGYEFATWLANQEPASRTRVEDLDLSVRAFNLLRSLDVRFVDQIDLDTLDDPKGRRVRAEIAEKLRRWRGDDGAADALVPR
jgi:hypothetical protein